MQVAMLLNSREEGTRVPTSRDSRKTPAPSAVGSREISRALVILAAGSDVEAATLTVSVLASADISSPSNRGAMHSQSSTIRDNRDLKHLVEKVSGTTTK